jgi:hypothetical protein
MSTYLRYLKMFQSPALPLLKTYDRVFGWAQLISDLERPRISPRPDLRSSETATPQTRFFAPQNITWSEETFRFNDRIDCPTHCRIERQPETDEQIAAAIEAACSSCVEAIRYCGTDPKILARFRELGYERLCDALVRPPA